MELQISCDICAEEEEECDIRQNKGGARKNITRAGKTKRVTNNGRQREHRSCAHVHRNTAEVRSVIGARIPEGEKRNSDSANCTGESKELWRGAFLGKRVCGIDDRL